MYIYSDSQFVKFYFILKCIFKDFIIHFQYINLQFE